MGVIHLFGHPAADFDAQALIAAVNDAKGRGTQVVTVAMLGHKADMAFMAVSADMRELRALQTAIQNAGVFISDSYVSLTEVSEYAANVPEEMRNARLYPRCLLLARTHGVSTPCRNDATQKTTGSRCHSTSAAN